jgi:hypothetical protein
MDVAHPIVAAAGAVEIVGRRGGHEGVIARTAGGILDVGVGVASSQAARATTAGQ